MRQHWPWVVLGVASVALAGLPGHTVPWFSGDLAYHTAVSRTTGISPLSGQGPYEGLPSYYGGTLTVVLAAFRPFGLAPELVESVVSWFEPAFWVASAAVFGRGMWPGSRPRRLLFAVLLVTCVGLGADGQLGVFSPTVSGQVFWPLYPRDLALMLTLVAAGLALGGHGKLAGVACGLAVASEMPLGVITSALTVIALCCRRPGLGGLRDAGVAMAVALATSAWWWVPRTVWTLSWGTSGVEGEFLGDAPHEWSTFARAFLLLLPLAAVGLQSIIRTFHGVESRFLLWWSALAAVGVAISLLVPTEFYTFRRALLVASVPALVLAAHGGGVIAEWSPPRWRAVAVFTVLVAVAIIPAIPTVVATRDEVQASFADETLAHLDYPDEDWSSVWTTLRSEDGEVLAPPRDAAITWIRTGRPVAYGLMPLYVKTWFAVDKATGWDETDRSQEVGSAFLNDPARMCALMHSHRIPQAILRADDGMIGLLDVAGYDELSSMTTSPVEPIGSSPTRPLVLSGQGALTLAADQVRGLDRMRIWIGGAASASTMELRQGGRRLTATEGHSDGNLQALDFDVSRARPAPLELRAAPGRGVAVHRVVGLRRSVGAKSPATVLDQAEICALT